MLKIRLEAWVLFIILGTLLYVAINIQAGWLFVVAFVVFGYLVSSLAFTILWVGGNLTALRFYPRSFEGEMVDGLIRISNHASVNKYFLIFEERFPGKAGPKAIYRFLPLLEAGKTIELAVRERAERRGIFNLGGIWVQSIGPSGLFEWNRKISCKGALTVYPVGRPFQLNLESTVIAPYPGEKGIHFGRGGEEEFFGVREYEPGDNARAIHWPSTAKSGTLMIREMSRTHPAVFTIFVDQDRRLVGPVFEDIIRYSTYALEEILKAGHTVRLCSEGEIEGKEKWGALETLAYIEALTPLSLPEQMVKVLPLLLGEKQLLVFSALPKKVHPSDWDFVKTFRDSFVSIHFFFYDSPTDSDIKESEHRANLLSTQLKGEGGSVTFIRPPKNINVS